MSSGLMPEEFRDLEPFVAWSLPSERERIAKRLATPMDEIIEFHDKKGNRPHSMVARALCRIA